MADGGKRCFPLFLLAKHHNIQNVSKKSVVTTGLNTTSITYKMYSNSYIRQLESVNTTYIPLASEFSGLMIKLVLLYPAKGKKLNLGIGKSGAKFPVSHEENR
jgi:hypothetical protein